MSGRQQANGSDTFRRFRLGLLCCVTFIASERPILAADVPAAPSPDLSNTLTFEVSPEFHAIDKPGSYSKGELDDYNFKIGLSHAFESGFVLGTAFDHTAREPDESSNASTYEKSEISLGYKIKALDVLTITPSAVLGYAFGDQPQVDPHDAYQSAAYYAFTLAVACKVTPALTWNVVEVRYRDAFDYTWKTPKIQTGLTFNVNPANAVYVNAGKSWKDNGNGKGYVADKINFALGWKYSF